MKTLKTALAALSAAIAIPVAAQEPDVKDPGK